MLRFDRVSPWLLCAATLLSACGGGGDAAPSLAVNPPPAGPPSATPPTITTQPKSQTVAAGGSATFTVAASNGPLVYQWLVSSSLVGVFTEIRGATSASYTVSSAGAADNGHYYRVLVTNIYGSVPSDPVQLVVTGVGGGGGPVADSCGPWRLASGTEVRTSYTTTTPAFSGESVQTVNAPVTFDGQPRIEVRLVQPLSSTVTLDARIYGEPDSATGHVTVYGSLGVSTADLGGSTNQSSVTSVFTTPTLDTEFALAPGGTATARTVTAVDTTVVSLGGVAQAPTTTSRTDTLPATTFVGYETVSVPAGTFSTCKYTTAGSSTARWLLRGYGSVVKDSAGGQATQIKVNGSVITGN